MKIKTAIYQKLYKVVQNLIESWHERDITWPMEQEIKGKI